MPAARRIVRALLMGIAVLVLLAMTAWTTAALYYVIAPGGWARPVLAGAFVLTLLGLFAFPPTRRLAAWMAVGAFCLALVAFLALSPSNERAWIAREAQTPWAEVEGDRLTIHNVRNFHYRTEDDFDARWESRIYDLGALETIWFLLAKFPDNTLAAHTFVSFGFAGGDYLGVSIEARKEHGEEYGILPGLFRQFETIYVAGDERDLIGLRTHVRRNDVYLYPMKSTPAGRRAFLLDIVRRMNELRTQPAFYNTLLDTCTTGLYTHLRNVRPEPTPMSYEVFVSGLSDRRAYDLGLIDAALPLDEARKRFRIDPSVATPDAPDFSAAIRRR